MDEQYLAGFFDGEGCISTRGDRYHLMLRVGNTDKRVLDLIVARYGGKVYLSNRGPRPYYTIKVTSNELCQQWLELMLPHLIVKKAQAIVALRICNRPPTKELALLNRKLRTLKCL